MKRVIGAVAAATVATLCSATSADVSFGLNLEFSGAVAPAGSGPWMTVTFKQNGANNVRMTIQNALSGTECATKFYFNLVQPMLPTNLTVAFNNGLSSGGTTPNAILKKTANPLADATFKADGDGYFDFRIDWSNNVFNGSEKTVFDISGVGLLESHFDAMSEPGGGNGSYHAAAHVQQTGSGGQGSGWIGDSPQIVPIPPAAWAGGATMLGLIAVRRFRRR